MADSTRRVSVRLSLDDATKVKAGLRDVAEAGQRSLEQIKGGAERASHSLDLLDVAVRGVQIAGLAAGVRCLRSLVCSTVCAADRAAATNRTGGRPARPGRGASGRHRPPCG